MLNDLWPPFGLVLRTGSIELRLPREEELAQLAAVAGRGVHPPDQRPFLTPWTEGDATDREWRVLRGHWSSLAGWDPSDWELALGVFTDGEADGEAGREADRQAGGRPVGMAALRARDFAVVREVTTWSWLGSEHHGRGFGTSARIALLSLAFDHLGAGAARSDVFQDNHASQAISRKLGYRPDGISVDARGSEALISDRLRLTRESWQTRDHPPVIVTGLEPCLPLLGLGDDRN